MLTLTFAQDLPREQVRHHLQHLIRALRRQCPALQYVAIREFTDRGRLHLHLICAPWVWIRWYRLRDMWQAETGAWVIWVRWINDEFTAAQYVGKYLLKRECVPDGKALSWSKGWPQLPAPGGNRSLLAAMYINDDHPLALGDLLDLGWMEPVPEGWQDAWSGDCGCFDPEGGGQQPSPTQALHYPEGVNTQGGLGLTLSGDSEGRRFPA